jgi:hypothetical protein
MQTSGPLGVKSQRSLKSTAVFAQNNSTLPKHDRLQKNSLPMLAAAFMVAADLSTSVLAQPTGTPPPGDLIIDYQKPLPGKSSDYVRMERE